VNLIWNRRADGRVQTLGGGTIPSLPRTQRRKESTKARKHVLKIKLSPLAGHLPPAAAQWLSVLSQIQLTLPWVMDCAAPPRAGCSLGAGVRRTKGCRPYFSVRFVGALLGQRFREEFCRHFYPLRGSVGFCHSACCQKGRKHAGSAPWCAARDPPDDGLNCRSRQLPFVRSAGGGVRAY
jgi:hypothetical protein